MKSASIFVDNDIAMTNSIIKIVGYYTTESCVLGEPERSEDPPIKYVVEYQGGTNLLSPPLDPSSIEEVNRAQSISPGNIPIVNLEKLLRIDPASGEQPVPDLKWDEFFFVDEDKEKRSPDPRKFGEPATGIYTRNGKYLGYHQPEMVPTAYNTSNHILDKQGTVIGYYNIYELYNQAGKLVAEKQGDIIIHEGRKIGYFHCSKLYDLNGNEIGSSSPGNGKVFKDKRIVANTADHWRNRLNNLFFSRKYYTGTPDFSVSKINELTRIVEEFRPATREGKAFRHKLITQLELIKNLRQKIKKDPKETLRKNPDRLSSIVAVWILAEDRNLDAEGLRLIINATKAKDPYLRHAAVSALGKLKKGLETVFDALTDSDPGVRLAALEALENQLEKICIEASHETALINQKIFASIFTNKNNDCHTKALGILSKNDPQLVNRLIDKAINDSLPVGERVIAIKSLEIIKAEEIYSLLPFFSSFPPELRAEMAQTIPSISPESIEDFAKIVFTDPSVEVRRSFFDSLYDVETDLSESILLQAIQIDPGQEVIDAAINSLRNVAGKKTLAFIGKLLGELNSETIPEEVKKKLAEKYGKMVSVLTQILDEKSLLLLRLFMKLSYEAIQEGVADALRTLARQISPGSTTSHKILPLLFEFIPNTTTQKAKGEIWSILMDIDYKEAKEYCKKFIPEFRKLLNDRDWNYRNLAATVLIRLDDNIFPLIEEMNPFLIDSKILNNIGWEMGKAKNNHLFDVVHKSILENQNDSALKKNTYILMGILEAWEGKRKSLPQLEGRYFNLLKRRKSDPTLERFAIQVLAKQIKLYKDPQKAEAIARKLLQEKGALETFILRNLAAIREHLPRKMQKSIEDKVKRLLISTRPPYQEWFNKAKNPNKIIVAKVYFQNEIDEWERMLKADGFEKAGEAEREKTVEKKVNGVTLRVKMVDISDEQGKLRTNIFQDLADPAIHYLGYNGHAGMGGNLEMSSPRGIADPAPYGTKIIHIGACSSMSSYYARVLKLAPGAQFIGNVINSYSEDDAKVFIAAMNGIAFQKSWDEINADLKKKTPFIYHKQNSKSLSFLNHMFPNNIDQFKYAVLDELEVIGAATLSFSAPRQEILDINSLFGGRLRQAVNNVNVSFIYYPFFENAEIVTGNEVHDGIYFLSPTDSPEPLNIQKIRNHTRPIYEIELNAGYSHLSVDALSILLIYELNTFFSKEKHEPISREDKLRGLLMVTEYIHYHYQRREAEGEQMFELFKQKYEFSRSISFEEVWRLQNALDKDLPQAQEIKKHFLEKIN